MATLEEFGPYLLLKKLGEDSLGETFRAGRIGAEGVEQVVLLRVFNGRNVNGARLWEKIAGRRGVQESLKNPNLGDGIGLGEVRGIPYVAYDYVSGKSLTQLLVQASTENQPIPLDHALLIVERVSMGLATAYETKLEGQRLVHGFVVPHLVMISNEGEARLLGFEAAPGLVDLARGGAFGSEVTRYLAPEAHTTGVAEKSDDPYSLGVLLYELTTCRPLPEPGDQGFGPILESAHIPGDGGPLPAEVARLLARSLAPRGERIGDAVSWHKAVSKVMAESGHNATAFNLAFFMHNLFRTDIERESREIEAEKTMEIPASALAGSGAARPAADRPAGRAGAAAPAESQATAEPVTMPHPVAGYGALSQTDDDTATGSPGGGKGLWIGLAAALLLLVGGAAWYFLMGPGAGPSEQELAAQAPPPIVEPEPVVEEPPPEPAGPTPEEIQAQISAMIDTRSDEMESKFREQYDDRIQQLQRELEAAQKEAEERERLERERLEREAAEKAEQERLAAEKAEQERLAAEKAEQERLAAEQAAADGTATGADGASGQQGGARTAAQTPPPEPKVRLGDLVSFGPGVKGPELVSIPEVRYPPMARKLGKEATVEVRLLVDETGRVTRTETVGKSLGFGFEDSAIEAAQRAKYRPATKDGVRVKMWTSVKLRFENP